MPSWDAFAQHALNIFNALVIAYFFAGNGVYTVLMLISVRSALADNRRLGSQDFSQLRRSPATPPVTFIIPARNEQESILDSVYSALQSDYPEFHVIVVDDGSTDETLTRLIREYKLAPTDVIARPSLAARPTRRVYRSLAFPRLTVISKENGGKADALNAGINFCRAPYFCILDADCVAEPGALLRLMRPIIQSPNEALVSGGVIRVRNGCDVAHGRVERVRLPSSWIEKLQVVEYLRAFLFGRLGWDRAGGTLIVSGAMAVFQRQRAVEAGGFSGQTVSEDMELITRLRRRAAREGRRAKFCFVLDTICWTECPVSLAMLARQRRRWHLGLCQTLRLHFPMLWSRGTGAAGLASFGFQLLVEALGSAVELAGYCVIPFAFALRLASLKVYVSLIILSLIYASFLSVGAALIEELTCRRYPSRRDFLAILGWSAVENFGFRQLIVWFRVQGIAQFVMGRRGLETVRRAPVQLAHE